MSQAVVGFSILQVSELQTHRDFAVHVISLSILDLEMTTSELELVELLTLELEVKAPIVYVSIHSGTALMKFEHLNLTTRSKSQLLTTSMIPYTQSISLRVTQ